MNKRDSETAEKFLEEKIIEVLDEIPNWVSGTVLDEFRFKFNTPMMSSWDEFYEENEDEIEEVSSRLSERASEGIVIYPPIECVFRTFIPLSKIKVVILGQDPYHNGSATGLCFSVKKGQVLNPSLKNIIKSLERSGFEPSDGVMKGDLSSWLSQGCFLFNTALTVEQGSAGSHCSLWSSFSIRVIRYLLKNKKGLCWILFGGKAVEAVEKANCRSTSCGYFRDNGHFSVISSHPSPFSVHNNLGGNPSFYESESFKRANDGLVERGGEVVRW